MNSLDLYERNNSVKMGGNILLNRKEGDLCYYSIDIELIIPRQPEINPKAVYGTIIFNRRKNKVFADKLNVEYLKLPYPVRLEMEARMSNK